MPYSAEYIDFGSHLSLGRPEEETRLCWQEALHDYSCHCVEIVMTLDENGWVVHQVREGLEVHQAVSSAVVSCQSAAFQTQCKKNSHLLQHHQSYRRQISGCWHVDWKEVGRHHLQGAVELVMVMFGVTSRGDSTAC